MRPICPSIEALDLRIYPYQTVPSFLLKAHTHTHIYTLMENRYIHRMCITCIQKTLISSRSSLTERHGTWLEGACARWLLKGSETEEKKEAVRKAGKEIDARGCNNGGRRTALWRMKAGKGIAVREREREKRVFPRKSRVWEGGRVSWGMRYWSTWWKYILSAGEVSRDGKSFEHGEWKFRLRIIV